MLVFFQFFIFYDKLKKLFPLFFKNRLGAKNLHLASPGATACDYGVSVEQSDCETEVNRFAKMAGKTPGRGLQIGSGGGCLDGSWGQVPLGCSVQSGGDWAAVYKTDGIDNGDGCTHTMYQLVCSTSGIVNILIVYVFYYLFLLRRRCFRSFIFY